jgi:hypothetical protein
MKRAPILGPILLVVLLVAVALAAFQGGRSAEEHSPGFGRDWKCTSQPQGDRICIRSVAPDAAAKQTKP